MLPFCSTLRRQVKGSDTRRTCKERKDWRPASDPYDRWPITPWSDALEERGEECSRTAYGGPDRHHRVLVREVAHDELLWLRLHHLARYRYRTAASTPLSTLSQPRFTASWRTRFAGLYTPTPGLLTPRYSTSSPSALSQWSQWQSPRS
jgi:hypothetical protein